MMRVGFFALFILLAVGMTLGLRNCQERHSPAAPKADMSSIVILKDGAVLTAPRGTVGRDIIDWLDSPNPGERTFELGGKEFEGRSIEPTMESKLRIDRFSDILRSHLHVTADIIGYTAATNDADADMKLSVARAEWLVRALKDKHISGSRLTASGRGGADPIGDNATPAGRARNERVALHLVAHP